MKEMTKTQLQERQAAIWNRIDELDEASKTRELTAEEQKEQRSLIDESAKLSTRAKALATGAELAQIREREDKGKELREMIEQCYTNRRAANATTILANAITSGDDQNTTANLEAVFVGNESVGKDCLSFFSSYFVFESLNLCLCVFLILR